jgi:hypothetical protein
MAICDHAELMLVSKNQNRTFRVHGARNINKVIIHIAEGNTLVGIKNWFENPEKPIKGKNGVITNTFGTAGAHFAISKEGEIWQLIDTKNEAWGAGSADPDSIHVENCGYGGNTLTGAQIVSNAKLLNWARTTHGVPLALNFSMGPDDMGPPGLKPLGLGLGYHAQYGGHPNCPGIKIICQLSQILKMAKEFAGKLAFADELSGTWQVKMNPWNWVYTFDENGTVVWVDPFNKKTGKGSWWINSGKISIFWLNSSTEETWKLPLSPYTKTTGECTMDKKKYDLQATRNS